MKKFLSFVVSTVILTLTVFFLVGCNNQSNQAKKATADSVSEEDYLIGLAEKADTYAEVFEILKINNSKEFQLSLANSESNIVQEALLNYEQLAPEALIAICEDPKMPNIEAANVKQYFVNAICNANLTEEQELQIAKTDKYAMQSGVIHRKVLHAEALMYVIKANSTWNYVLNINHFQIKKVIYQQILNVSLTTEQKEELKNLNNSNINKALQEKERIEFQKKVGIIKE